ncbi:MAG: polysaccharide deacetylase family protein [Sandaracinaceae bacterium]|nr:polysaccharide deacetylase family protein [Sandaracinaceae bacterium]
MRASHTSLLVLGIVSTLVAVVGPVSADGEAVVSNASLARPSNAPRVIMGSTHHRRIHFTFDDGPEPRTTPAMLQALDELHVKATFFLSAWRLDANRRGADERAVIAQEILRRGHAIGSHSFQHEPMPPMSEAGVVDQIERSGSILTRVVGFRPVFFRPPHGLRSTRVDSELARRDYTTVIWNLNPTDYSVRDAETVLHHFNNMLRYRVEHENVLGGIVLMHDTHMWSVEGFRLIYNELMTRNCELLQRNEELFDIVDTLEPFLYPEGQEPASLGTEHDAAVRARAEAFCHARASEP